MAWEQGCGGRAAVSLKGQATGYVSSPSHASSHSRTGGGPSLVLHPFSEQEETLMEEERE